MGCFTSTVTDCVLIFAVSLIQLAEGAPAVSNTLADHSLVLWFGLVSAVVFLVVVVYSLINCNDCYNSEVSTDCHPATNSGVKWGGAGNQYSSAPTHDVGDSVLAAGYTGEVITPGGGGNHPLPYAMIPTQVPEAHGFRGYEATGAQGLSGYGSPGGWASAPSSGGGNWGGSDQGRSRNMPGAHASPMMHQQHEDPPPAYFSAS